MPNHNYIKGRKKEYRKVSELKTLGCPIAFRSAGSHSPIDVVGINPEERTIMLVQCQTPPYA